MDVRTHRPSGPLRDYESLGGPHNFEERLDVVFNKRLAAPPGESLCEEDIPGPHFFEILPPLCLSTSLSYPSANLYLFGQWDAMAVYVFKFFDRLLSCLSQGQTGSTRADRGYEGTTRRSQNRVRSLCVPDGRYLLVRSRSP